MQNTIRIGTLVPGGPKAPDYIRQIIHHGFESFSITFGPHPGETDLKKLSEDVKEAIGDHDAIISSLGVFGNPLGDRPVDLETVKGWERCIDQAHLFGANIVAGFAGRVVDRPVPESMPKFKKVFGELARRAEDKGVRIAFENCDMGGTWERGDWNIAYNPSAWELMFNEVPSEVLGLEWEPSHPMIQLIDPLPQLREWVKRIYHVHGKDATLYRDVLARHGRHSPHTWSWGRTPGFGETNWVDVFSELRFGGYTGTIDIEGWHDPVYRDDWEMAGQVYGLNYLKRCRCDWVPNPA